jgi:glycosyltransferase involved in cell wall biosynthesis
MMPTISLLCPAIGRSTLATIRDQFLAQRSVGDEFIVVGDGPQPASRAICDGIDTITYLEHGPTNHWGSEQLDYAALHATGDYLAYIGDDDELAPNALLNAHRALSDSDPHPYLFATLYGGQLWKCRFSSCQCTGQQFIVPSDPSRLARYGDKPDETNDWNFMSATVANYDHRIEFRHELFSIIHRRNYGRVF